MCKRQQISKAATTLCTLLLCEPGVKHVMLYESIQPQFNKRILPTSQEEPNQEVIQQVMHLSVCWNGVSACCCCHTPPFISCFEMRFSRWTVDLRDRLRKQSSIPPPSTLRGWRMGGGGLIPQLLQHVGSVIDKAL